jgi:hypothetical protein
VLRGKFILNYIVGVPAVNPPPGVPPLNDKDIGTTKALTVRELMAKHRANPTCASCHAVMEPLGFALENFDATGMWRDKDRFANAPIDSAGELPDGTKINGPDDLRKTLLRHYDLVDGPHARLLRHADRPPDRARHAGEGLQIFGHRAGGGQK